MIACRCARLSFPSAPSCGETHLDVDVDFDEAELATGARRAQLRHGLPPGHAIGHVVPRHRRLGLSIWLVAGTGTRWLGERDVDELDRLAGRQAAVDEGGEEGAVDTAGEEDGDAGAAVVSVLCGG